MTLCSSYKFQVQTNYMLIYLNQLLMCFLGFFLTCPFFYCICFHACNLFILYSLKFGKNCTYLWYSVIIHALIRNTMFKPGILASLWIGKPRAPLFSDLEVYGKLLWVLIILLCVSVPELVPPTQLLSTPISTYLPGLNDQYATLYSAKSKFQISIYLTFYGFISLSVNTWVYSFS